MNIEFLSAVSENVPEAAYTVEWSLWSYLSSNTGVNPYVITVLFVAACIVIPYLLGSINPAIIFSKLFYHDDIRTHGSGNAGATNTLRTYGKKMSILVFACDLLKAGISTGIGWFLMGHSIGAAIAGFFVIFGHMFPIYYRFKGGKGVACACMVVLMTSPLSFAVCAVVFLAVVAMTKYVSMASVMGIALYPLTAAAFLQERQGAIGIFAVLVAGFIIFMHRENLKRIYRGEENKLSFGKKKEESKVEKAESTPRKVYTAEDFIECPGCKQTIPVTRKKCVYCGEENPVYKEPEESEKPEKKKKK